MQQSIDILQNGDGIKPIICKHGYTCKKTDILRNGDPIKPIICKHVYTCNKA